MIPSKRWFPTTLQARVAWFDNFAAQFSKVAIDLGFTAANVTAVDNDNAMMQFIGASDLEVAAYEKAVGQYRKIFTEADIGDVTPSFPANPTLAPPALGVTAGIYERLNKLVDQIEAADNYTTEIGAMLGILPKGETPNQPEDMKPDLKPKAQPEFMAQIAFVRGKTDGIALQIQRDNEDAWTSVGSFFKSPAMIQLTPKTPNTPEVIRIRGRFLIGNTPTGEFSDIN